MGTLKLTPTTRFLEWLADRVSWVQYPKPRFYDADRWTARIESLTLVVGACLLPIVLGGLAGLLDVARPNPTSTTQPGKRGFSDHSLNPLPAMHGGRPENGARRHALSAKLMPDHLRVI